jgi:hypothetical protein
MSETVSHRDRDGAGLDIPLRNDDGWKLLQANGSPVDSQIIHELKKMLSSNSLMSLWASFESNQRMRSVPDLKTPSRTVLSSLWLMICSLTSARSPLRWNYRTI